MKRSNGKVAGVKITISGSTITVGIMYQKLISQIGVPNSQLASTPVESPPNKLNAVLICFSAFPLFPASRTDNNLMTHCSIGSWIGLYSAMDIT